MDSLKKLFIILYYYLAFNPVECRISNERRCVDADCSVPISVAKTLLRYHSDDERVLSFLPNSQAKIYSKEAGDNPTFWEAEDDSSNKCVSENYQGSLKMFLELCQAVINGKRGYVPKSLLRENKMLVNPKSVNLVVPTGRIEDSKENITQENVEKLFKKPDDLTRTPELPAANSKGLFTMIGGVSADSVPMSSPDINPQSTSKFQVIDGTTIYDDPGSEKPDTLNQVLSEVKETPSVDNKPSKEDNKLTEEKTGERLELGNNESVLSSFVNEQKIGQKVDKLTEESSHSAEIIKETVKDVTEGSQSEGNVVSTSSTAESTSKPGLINNIVDTVTYYMSGSGESEKEEEEEEEEEDDENSKDEEGSAEEGNNVDSKGLEMGGNNVNDVKPSVIERKEILAKPSEETVLEDKEVVINSQDQSENQSEAPNFVNIVNENRTPHVRFENTIDTLKTDKNSFVVTAGDDVKAVSVDKIKQSDEIQTNIKDNIQNESDSLSAVAKESITERIINMPETPVLTGNIETNVFESQVEKVVNKVEDSEPIPTETTKYETVNNQHPHSSEKQYTSDPFTEVYNKEEMSGSLNKNTTTVPEAGKDLEVAETAIKSSAKEAPTKPSSGVIEEEQYIKTSNEEQIIKPVYEEPVIPSSGESLEVEQTTKREFLYKSMKMKQDDSAESESVSTEATSQPEFATDEIKQQAENLQDISTPVSGTPSHPLLEPVQTPKYFSMISNDSDTPIHIANEEYEKNVSEDIIVTSTSNPPDQINTLFPIVLDEKQTVVEKFKEEPFGDSKEISHQPVTSEDKTKHKEEFLEVVKEIFPQDVTSSSEDENKPKEESLEDVKKDVIPASSEEISTDSNMVETITVEAESVEPSEGMFSWLSPIYDLFASSDVISEGTGEVQSSDQLPPEPGNLDSSQTSFIKDDSCLADGVGEAACRTFRDVPVPKDVSWQESFYTSDMSSAWDLLEKIPLETTIWLIITAVVVLIFSLGHYYIEAHRRDGPLVAVINKLEREVLIMKKESCILEDRLQLAQQQLEAWNASCSENDALIVDLKQELEETKAVKVELEEQVTTLKEELDSVTESGLEMHRLLEESLSSQDGSQVLLTTVETLREKLQHQEDEIAGLSQSLSHKIVEVEELQEKLAQSAGVSRSLEEKIIAITREKEEEALQLKDKHRQLMAQLEEVVEIKALDETRVSTEMSKLRLKIEELQKVLAEKDSELDVLKEVVKQVRSTDSNEKMDALFDVVGTQARLKTAMTERDEYREKFHEEEGARKLLEGHMKKITQEVADLKNRFETAEKEKIEALTKLQVLSNYFKEKESELQKELGMQESMWLQKQSDDHSIYEQMRSLREENEKYKLQNESLKKEIVEQEASFKIQLANVEQKAHENWVTSRQAERKVKEVQQEAAQLRNRLTMEKNTSNYSMDEKQNISESNGDPSSPPPSLIFPPTTSPPFMMYPMPPPGDFVPPPPLMGSPYPSDSRPPPLGRISSPPLDHRFSPPLPLPYPPYDYPSYGHHSPSPPPPIPPHHRTVHKPQPREMPREQKDHVPTYSPDADKTTRRNKR